MAVAMRCDRCKKFYNKPWLKGSPYASYIHEVDAITYNFAGNQKCEENYDLCPDCSILFTKWMNEFNDDQDNNDVEEGGSEDNDIITGSETD